MALALLLVAACDVHEPVSIPPGATEVHVGVTQERVTLTPASVPAGQVYLVNEGPGQGVEFVKRAPGPEDEPGPMDAAQAARVRAGDLQSTGMELFQVSCAPEGWTETRGWEGCGNVIPLTLAPGLYVIRAPGGDPGIVVPSAVLEVVAP